MENVLQGLMPLFQDARARGTALALATLIDTAGSTYRKSGTHMLIATDGRYAGLLSGGCLEGDLAEHARHVIASRQAVIVSYDMRSAEDPLWGLGSGCEGAMRVLLGYCGPENAYEPLATLVAAEQSSQALEYGMVIAGVPERIGCSVMRTGPGPQRHDTVLWLHYAPPPWLVLCGGGPDACPVATLARFLGWRISIIDHRPAYLHAGRFPSGVELHADRPQPLRELLRGPRPQAAVVMSHHLDTDRGWLRALAGDPPAYVGLLGPGPRRQRLLAELPAAERAALRPVLHAPVGLDLGGRAPESIALSIVAEIQATLHGRHGGPFDHG